MRPTVLLVLRLLPLLFCSPVIVFPPLASFTLVLIPRPRASTTIRLFATTTLVQRNVLNLGNKSVVADRRDDFARSVKEGRVLGYLGVNKLPFPLTLTTENC